MGAVLLNTLKSMAARLLTGYLLEKVVIWACELLVVHTKTPHDDKLLEMVKEALDKPKES